MKKIKKWKPTDFECPECGSTVYVNTSAGGNFYYDGDELKCSHCNVAGQVMVDEVGNASDYWDF